MKFGLCNEIFQNWKIEDAMEYAARLGYHGLEIAPFTLAKSVTDISKTQRNQIRRHAEKLGLEICGLHWVLVQTEGLYLNHPDAEIRERTKKYFCELVKCCSDLGGQTIVLGSPKQRNILPEITAQQAWDLAEETLDDAVKHAEDRNVTICFEPLAPSETDFINTAAEAIRFAKRFKSPAMKIILDVKAMCTEDKTIPQIIRESAPHFAHFHANDKNLKGPGFGEVDFKPIAAALKQSNYHGYVSVEVFKFEEGPEVIASKSLEYLRRSLT